MQTLRRNQHSFRAITTLLLAVAGVALAGMATPAAAQTYTVVSNFFNLVQGPGYLQFMGAIPQGRDGNLYGLSHEGGTSNIGTFFNVSPSGTETTVYSFDGTKGSYPNFGLTLGSDGNFYGTAANGGTANLGTFYKITSTGTITVLHNFTNTGDGGQANTAPTQGTDGNFYGVTSVTSNVSTAYVYKITPAGVYKTLHTLSTVDGYDGGGLIQGIDGSFYGLGQLGGANNCGTAFKVSTSGAYAVLHNFTCTDGNQPIGPMVQGTDGNLYGITYAGGTTGDGVIFKMTTSGKLTVLRNMNSATDGKTAQGALMQATDGNLYGTTFTGGTLGGGTIFKITTAGAFTVLHNFDSTNSTTGSGPGSTLTQHTNGLLYGDTYYSPGGAYGVFYSLDIGAAPFIRLSAISGKAGSQVGIFGQGFSASSVVKFNGVAATAAVLTGTTYITATVPAGASTGLVTVTTGSTTLTSLQKYLVHDSWSSGAAMPVAMKFPAGSGLASGKIYMVGGITNTAILTNNQVYNPATNTWSTGAALPTPTWGGASAVVSNVLYVFGGYIGNSGPATNAVWAYKPSTNTWTAKAAMPTARGSEVAVVKGTIIYVIGGNGPTNRLNTVESYNTATNAWTTEAPLLVGKSEPSAGLLGSTIVAAGGYTASMDTGDNEGYNPTTNSWKALTLDPTARNGSCAGSIASQLYVAGGGNNSDTALSLNESYSATTNKWTTLAPIPLAVSVPGSAVASNLLYCIGGGSRGSQFVGVVYNNVQIYQP